MQQTRAINTPSPAAAIGTVTGTFPNKDEILYANSPYNLTAGMQVPSISTVVDSANLLVEREGITYSNTSLTNLGTYNATYSFQNDRAGGLAEGVGYSSGASCQVYTSYLSHQKVHSITGVNGWRYTYFYSAGAVTSLTVQFWYAVSGIGAGDENCILVCSSSATTGPFLETRDNLFQYRDGSLHSLGIAAAAGRWYWINISVDTVTDRWNCSIDGVQCLTNGIFYINNVLTDVYYLSNYQYTVGYTCYLDAVDFNNTAGFVQGRSAIDLGQVGVYNATRSWENETMFAVPGGFTASEAQAGNSRVYPAVPTAALGHHNVFRMTSAGATNTNTFTEGMPTITCASGGSVEFWGLWTAFGGSASSSVIYIGNAAESWKCLLTVPNTGIMEATGNGVAYTTTLSLNTWYHFRFTFDATTFSFYLNGMLKASKWDDFASPATLEQIYFHSYLDSIYYIDALDYSSDPSEQYYPERSTFMWCNTTLSFPDAMNRYNYRYQCWSSNVMYEQPAVPFSVVANVQLISESNVKTSWVFINDETTWTNLYTADFGAEDYYLTPGSGVDQIDSGWMDATEDAYVDQDHPTTNYGTESSLRVGGGLGRELIPYFQWFPASYLHNNLSTYAMRVYYSTTITEDIGVFRTADFEEDTITWDNKPYEGAYPYQLVNLPTGSVGYHEVSFGVQGTNDFCLQDLDLVFWDDDEIASRESVNPPQFRGWIPKFNATENLAYIQTNTTETLTMHSPVFSSISLLPNDRIIVIYNTTSQRQISLNLKSGGNIVKTSALSEAPNYVYSTQTKQFGILEPLSIDQLEFTGLFDDTKNLQIQTIVIERPVGYTSYMLPPYSEKLTCLTPGAYYMTVFEGSNLVLAQNINVTLSALNTFSYDSINGGQRLVNFFNPSGELLDFYQFRCNLTRTYNNLTVNYILTTPYFSADDGSTFRLNVTDRFGNSIVNWSDVVSTFIDITLSNIYSLKIKNEMRLPTLLELTRNAVTQAEYAMAGEIVEYTLYAGDYALQYTQPELGTTIATNITVTAPLLYTLNSSWYSLYLGAFSNSLIGLQPDAVRLYVDGQRKSWPGPVELLGDTHNITALDYGGFVLFQNDALYLANCTEYNVFVNMWTNIFRNNFSVDVEFQIRKSGVLLFKRTVGSQGEFLFQFVDGVYEVKTYYLNGSRTSDPTRYITLEADTDADTISFGFMDRVVTTPVLGAVSSADFLISAVFLIALVALFAYTVRKLRGVNAARPYRGDGSDGTSIDPVANYRIKRGKK